MPGATGFAGVVSLGEILLRVGDELGAAAGGAEIVRPPAVLGAVLGVVRIDAHPAHRILGEGGRGGFLRRLLASAAIAAMRMVMR